MKNFEVPSKILNDLLIAEAVAAAHYKCCFKEHQHGQDSVTLIHPGDPFGNTLGWLWREGLKNEASQMVVTFVSEIRVHNPNRESDGNRPRWDDVLIGIGFATSGVLSQDERMSLKEYLQETVPVLYGQSPRRLNES